MLVGLWFCCLIHSVCFHGGWIRVNFKNYALAASNLTAIIPFILSLTCPSSTTHIHGNTDHPWLAVSHPLSEECPSFPPPLHPANSLHFMALLNVIASGMSSIILKPRWGPWLPLLALRARWICLYYHTHHIIYFAPCLPYWILSIPKQELCPFLLCPWCLVCAPAQSRHLERTPCPVAFWWWFSHWVVSDSWDPMDCSLSGSSIHGILQARILEWVAISFSRGSSQSRNWTRVSCIAGRWFTNWAMREAVRPSQN